MDRRLLIGAAAALTLGIAAATIDFPPLQSTQGIVSPLAPLDPASAERALDTEAARVDPLFIDQLAERQALWLRNLVAKGARESEVQSGLDAVDRWAHRAAQMRARAADIGQLEAMGRSAPADAAVHVAIARYWVRELELERDNIQSDRWEMFRIQPSAGTWVCLGCYATRGPGEVRSQTWPRARQAVDAALRLAPNNPAALWQQALLYRMVSDGYATTENAQARRIASTAAALQGPDAAAARVYLAMHDTAVGKLRQQAALDGAKQAVGSRPAYHYDNGRLVRDVPVPVFRNPTTGEKAQADSLSQQASALAAKQNAEVDAAMRDYSADPDIFRMLADQPLDRGADFVPQRERRERILRYAIMLDPTDWRLHLMRAANWNALGEKGLEQPSADFQGFLRIYHGSDYVAVYDRNYARLRGDAFIPYCMALEAVRRNPADPFAHKRLAMGLQGVIAHRIFNVPIVAGAFHQAVAEMKLTRLTAMRALSHPEEWKDAATQRAIQNVRDWANQQIAAIPAKPPAE